MTNKKNEETRDESSDSALQEKMDSIKTSLDESIYSAYGSLDQRYTIIDDLVKNYPNKETLQSSNEINLTTLQNLVVTDLFVEKDILVLTDRGDKHKKIGIILYLAAIIVFAIGTLFAFLNMPKSTGDSHWPSNYLSTNQKLTHMASNQIPPPINPAFEFTSNLIKSFTAYEILANSYA